MNINLKVLKRRYESGPKKFWYYANNNEQSALSKNIRETRIGPVESVEDLVVALLKDLRIFHNSQSYRDFEISNFKKENTRIQFPSNSDNTLTFVEGLSDEEMEELWEIIVREKLK